MYKMYKIRYVSISPQRFLDFIREVMRRGSEHCAQIAAIAARVAVPAITISIILPVIIGSGGVSCSSTSNLSSSTTTTIGQNWTLVVHHIHYN